MVLSFLLARKYLLRTQISRFSIELHRITELVNNFTVTVNQYNFTILGIRIFIF